MDVESVKRHRVSANNDCGIPGSMGMHALSEKDCSALLKLPQEVLEQILSKLDASSLLNIAQTCKAFKAWDGQSGLRLVEKIAKGALVASAGEQLGRWRRRTWLQRLYIEDCGVGFDKFQWSSTSPQAQPQPPAGVPPQYKFSPSSTAGSYLNIKLDGMGPKLLVSDLSTADQPVLRWRLIVRGNTAVEFGVVPLNMQFDDKALHKCQQEEKKFDKLTGPLVDAERPTGFCSSITVGSMLPFKTTIMKGSVVELLARRGRLEIIVQNPPDGQELYWHNTRTVPKPYKGPTEVRFEQDFSPHHDIKLALTSWAHGAFDVMHPAPGSRLLGLELQTAWHLTRVPSSSKSSKRSGIKRKSIEGGAAPAASQQPQQPQQLGVMLVQQLDPPVPAQQQQQQQQQVEQQQAAPPLQPAAGPAGAGPSAAAAAAAPAVAAAAKEAAPRLAPASPASEESTASREGQLQS